MIRLNVVLLVLLLGSALALVNLQYESRRLTTESDRARVAAERLEAQRVRLEVDRRAQATPLRVERLARDQLGMRTPTPAITLYVRDASAQAPAAGRHP